MDDMSGGAVRFGVHSMPRLAKNSKEGEDVKNTSNTKECNLRQYRGTSLIRIRPLPQDHLRAPGTGPPWGPRLSPYVRS